MISDPIADLITRIRNGYAIRQKEIVVSYSAIKEEIAKILLKEGFLKEVRVEGKKPQEKRLIIGLKYHHKEPAITEIKRVSKPSLRIYIQAKNLKPFKGGVGMRILSTSKGVMSDKEAKMKNIGGEVICELW